MDREPFSQGVTEQIPQYKATQSVSNCGSFHGIYPILLRYEHTHKENVCAESSKDWRHFIRSVSLRSLTPGKYPLEDLHISATFRTSHPGRFLLHVRKTFRHSLENDKDFC